MPCATRFRAGTHNDRAPQFTVDEPDGDATLTCSATGPGGVAVTVTGCAAGSPTLDLATAGHGLYHLPVTATDPYGNAVTTTVSYSFDGPPPTTGSPPCRWPGPPLTATPCPPRCRSPAPAPRRRCPARPVSGLAPITTGRRSSRWTSRMGMRR